MLTYVPVVFDIYRPLKSHLRWTLQCLVGFADTQGRCFPSVRKLAEVTGHSKSTVARHLRDLEKLSAISRARRPGGVYSYRIDARFLPATRVSHAQRTAVPGTRREEQSTKNKSASVDFVSEVPWKKRMRGWQERRFWLPQWGPKPEEAGCFAPVG